MLYANGQCLCLGCNCISTVIKVVRMKIYGYYERPDQPIDQPTIDPDHYGPCLFCDLPLTDDDIRTHSLMPVGGSRSFFYRTHRSCHEAADDTRRNQIDAVVIDSIDHNGDGFTAQNETKS